MEKFKIFCMRFMQGRYGADQLNRFLLICYLVLILSGIFIKSIFLSYGALLVAVLFVFRSFSRNSYQRRRENEAFLEIRGKLVSGFRLRRTIWRERKTNVYRRCPSCRTMLRLPRKKGQHKVVCPRCRTEFHMKVR